MSNYTEIRDKDNALLGQLPVSKEGGRLRNVVYVTSTQQYEKPSWLKFIRVKGVAGGGGRGGCPSTAIGQAACAGAAGSGQYGEKTIQSSALGSEETVTIGEGGIGGTSGATTGGTGGATSFGVHMTLVGGSGSTGTAVNIVTFGPGGEGGAGAAGADYSINGMPGGYAYAGYPGGTSGGAVFGYAVGQLTPLGSYGTGAPGLCRPHNVAAIAGVAGSPGIVIIEEYE